MLSITDCDEQCIHIQIQECNNRLLSIKIPNVISRTPQTLHQFSKWKGKKQRNIKIVILFDCM